MNDLHSLLLRQLKRTVGTVDSLPEPVRRLLRLVNEAYEQFDSDRVLVERSLSLSSGELLVVNQTLRQKERRYRVLFEDSPLPMWVFHESSFAFLAVNKAACRHYGYTREEFLRMTILDIRPPCDEDALRRQIAMEGHGHQDAGCWRHMTKNGQILTVEITSDQIVFDEQPAQLVVAVDVTARQALEERLRQAQKMEAIGLLAGGVAHDFNNLLTVINGYAELARTGLSPMDPLLEHLTEIRRAGERAETLTRQLLAISRKQVLDPKPLRIDVIVADMQKLLRRVLGEDVAVELSLRGGVVTADAGQLEQVLMNLAVNARDAMPHGGELRIETATIACSAPLSDALPAGPYVTLTVSDTGTGMPPATLARIFEPFFTTKGLGKGTGLGLATVFGIIRQSGGEIRVTSAPGNGTTFTIYLPLLDDDANESDLRASSGIIPTIQNEVILLVEDDEPVRHLTQTMLTSFGYQVIAPSTTSEAITIASQHHHGSLHLLLTDIVMPGMSGPDLAERVASLHPEVRILFMSGYADKQGILSPDAAFLQKPFTPAALSKAIRTALHTR